MCPFSQTRSIRSALVTPRAASEIGISAPSIAEADGVGCNLREGALEQGTEPLVPRPRHKAGVRRITSHGTRHAAGSDYAAMGAGPKVIGAVAWAQR